MTPLLAAAGAVTWLAALAATFMHDIAPWATTANTALWIVLFLLQARTKRRVDETHKAVEQTHEDVTHAASAASAAAASAADAARIARDLGGVFRHTDPASPETPARDPFYEEANP